MLLSDIENDMITQFSFGRGSIVTALPMMFGNIGSSRISNTLFTLSVPLSYRNREYPC